MFSSSKKKRGKKYVSSASKRTINLSFCDKIKVVGLALIKVKTMETIGTLTSHGLSLVEINTMHTNLNNARNMP